MTTNNINNSNTRGVQMMTSWFGYSITIFGLVCAFSLSQAATLDSINYSVLPGERVQLQIGLSEPMQDDPSSFTIDNPARIALDFPDTTIGAAIKNQLINIGVAHSVSAVEAEGKTRIVVNLIKSAPYDIDVQGSTVTLTLGGDTSSSSSSSENYASDTDSMVEDIDFRRGDDGEGRIIITLSDPSVSVNMDQVGGDIILDFIGAELPDKLDRNLNVVDFATPVKGIDTKANSHGTRMVISTTIEDYDHLAYQSNDTFVVEVRALDEKRQRRKKEEEGFTGERLSLNFQDIEVRAVLQLFSDFTGLNVVLSDTVSGKVTLRLKNIPWDQALNIILKAKGLGMRQVDNVIMIAPQTEIATLEKIELEANQQIVELAPLRTEFIQINYAKAGDLATLIKAQENSLLSGRGSVTIDDRTNTLIVRDVSENLQRLREMIDKLDIPVRQVLIEARIVNADETFSKSVGVRLRGGSKVGREGSFGIDGSGNITRGTAGDDSVSGSVGGVIPGAGASNPSDYVVHLPVIGAAGALSFNIGTVGSWLLGLELSAALAEGRTEDIASPRVITTNQREAIIEQGVEIPYQEASSSGATTVSFKKAVLSLKVTPQITPNDNVLLDLTVNQDTQGVVTGGVPAINTKSVNTQVMVDNGETVVLGGVYSQVDKNDTDKIPLFGDLPIVGRLFKRTRDQNDRRELLIFITPKILGESLKKI